jgi:hypothetical protein
MEKKTNTKLYGDSIMKVAGKEFKMSQSELIELINRAKDRTSIKDSFYTKQLEDEIADLKHKKKFWSKKYFNLKKEMGLFFPRGDN